MRVSTTQCTCQPYAQSGSPTLRQSRIFGTSSVTFKFFHVKYTYNNQAYQSSSSGLAEVTRHTFLSAAVPAKGAATDKDTPVIPLLLA